MKIRNYLSCFAWLLGCCAGLNAQSLLVLEPNGGEQWLGASQQVISWTFNNVDNIDIQYSANNGLTWNNIVEDYHAAALSYTWTVPAIGSNQSLIRIISSLSFTEDQSDATFTIPEPTIDLVYPAGGTLATGTIQYAEWTTTGIGQVVLQYTTDSGATWTDVNTSPAEHGYSNWVTPATASNVQVRIHNIENINKNDVSGNINVVAANIDNPAKYAGSPFDGYDMSTSLPSVVTLSSPNGGEELTPYSTLLVEWAYTDVSWVDLLYSIDNGASWDTVASHLAADALSYAWVVPNTPSTQCLMKVTASIEGVEDVSNSTFVINSSVLTLTYPNNGEPFVAGTIQYIEWEYNGVSTVLAEYSTDGGESWTAIGTSPAEHRYINWIAPNAAGSTMILRLSDNDVPTLLDLVDAPLPCVQAFIDNPAKYAGSPFDGYSMNDNRPDTVQITSPNGGEVWMSSSLQTITWTYNNVDETTLEYTLDDGQTWTVISDQVQASQLSYNWTVPTSPSNLCRVRMTENARSQITDLSDEAFIIPTGYVQITYPNGGESFTTGTIQYIEWEHEGLETVLLEYSTDNGDTWIVIGTSPANDRYMNWFTPATAAGSCRIRVSDIDNGGFYYDESNVAFPVTTRPTDNPTKYEGSPYDGYSMYAYLDEYVKVIKPNGGEFWGNGSTQHIKWLVLNNSENLKVEYTTDGEQNWTTLLNNVPNTPNTYNWTINAQPSTICKVRATTLTGGESDKSDYFFTIANPSGITTNGIAGNTFCPGNTVNVSYSTTSSFNADNQFIVQLSDSLGTFSGPVENIGSVNSATPLPITATIPVRYYTSNLYRLRVIATSPPTLGTDNGSNFTINALPAVDLGEDVVLCSGNSQVLNASNPGASYVWSTGSTASSITVSQSGQYHVTVTNACGVTRDTVQVDVISAPTLDLGPDVQICENNVVVLEADSGAYAYQWSTGAATRSIIVSLPGNYSVSATNQCGTTTDQINVSLVPTPTIELGPNFAICPGQSESLSVNVSGATFLWSTGSTSNNISVNGPGTYWVNATTVCGVFSDQVVVYDGGIDLDAGEDVQLCAGGTATLFATGGNTYNWSNNLTGSIIEVSPSQTTTYTVNTSNIYGCEATDAVVVFVNDNPAVPQLTLQGPAVFCSNEASVLTATAQANVDYEWLRNNLVQAGEFGTELTPQLSGIYAVRVTNAAGCNATSTGVSITVNPTYDLTINLQTSGGLVEYNGESLVAGVYYYNYTTISGCDSLITVNVSDPEVIGCTDENACNYNPLAGTTDNTLCVYPGCGDLNACNYNGESACFNDQLCVFALPGLNCDGSCLNDSDGDGVCDENEVPGCTDLTACNYTTNATEDDGSCFWVYTYSIEISDTVTSDGNYVYSYPGNPMSTYQWSVTGGTIVGPDNNSEVVVAWDGTVEGEVCVVETYLGCQGNEVCETASITGIRSREQESLTIYPNPSNGQFWIDAAMNTNRSYHVMDALGRTIVSGTLLPGQNEVNLINLSPGSYVLQSGSFRMRVIIAR